MVEEVARVYGYTKLPATPPHLIMAMPIAKQQQLSAEDFSEVLVARGYQEVITYSFIDPELQQLFEPEFNAFKTY